MNRKLSATSRTETCRLGPGTVTVRWAKDKVSSVVLEPCPTSCVTYQPRCHGQLARDLTRVLSGAPAFGQLPIDTGRLSPFARRVLSRCAGIRPGQVMTYGELARAVGRPGAARAVGQVLAHNPFPLLVPCHRVVGAGLRLTGFRGGLAWKEHLLAQEGWRIAGGPT
ncbi:MAG: MGMT family protein, partial [candidate division WOR-3 bacterium]